MMPSPCKLIVLVFVLFGAQTSHGAWWDVRASVYSGGAYFYDRHSVGSPPFMLGFQEYHYSTDAGGLTIMPYSGVERQPQPGDTQHMYTQMFLGPFSFSVPMRPLPSLVICGLVVFFVSALFDFGLRYLRRKRYEPRVA